MFCFYKLEELYYLCSKIKAANQMHKYCTDGLCPKVSQIMHKYIYRFAHHDVTHNDHIITIHCFGHNISKLLCTEKR